MALVPECTECGACCFNASPRGVRVWGDDHARMGDLAETYAHFIGNQCYMRVEGERCAALAVTAAGSFTCAIYDVRPRVCRELERGSSRCEAERHEREGAVRRRLRVLRGE